MWCKIVSKQLSVSNGWSTRSEQNQNNETQNIYKKCKRETTDERRMFDMYQTKYGGGLLVEILTYSVRFDLRKKHLGTNVWTSRVTDNSVAIR